MTPEPTLKDMHCIAYGDKENQLSAREINQLRLQIADWQLIEVDGISRLQREFRFGDFIAALAFTNAVGGLAETEGHHPMLVTEWGRVTVQWWTHFVGGLHLNDFICAAKTDQLYP